MRTTWLRHKESADEMGCFHFAEFRASARKALKKRPGKNARAVRDLECGSRPAIARLPTHRRSRYIQALQTRLRHDSARQDYRFHAVAPVVRSAPGCSSQ